MIYTDAKVSYVVVGSIFDADTKQNLTDARLRQLNRVAWDQLPLDLAIKKVKGNGARKLAIFSDADCPYCKRLESEMKTLDNVTIYTFLFPIAQLHPDAARKSAMIWCAPDRSKAWDEWFASGKLPNNKGDCATPIAKTAQLGQKYRDQRDADPGVRRRLDGAGRHTAGPARERAQAGRGGDQETAGGQAVAATTIVAEKTTWR